MQVNGWYFFLRLYSIDEVCALFSIDSSTLRRWRSSANIAPVIDPSNHARRLYNDAQIVQLAELHHRVAVVASIDHEKLVQLERRIEVLEERALLVQHER